MIKLNLNSMKYLYFGIDWNQQPLHYEVYEKQEMMLLRNVHINFYVPNLLNWSYYFSSNGCLVNFVTNGLLLLTCECTWSCLYRVVHISKPCKKVVLLFL